MFEQIFFAAEGVDRAFFILFVFAAFIMFSVTAAMLWFLYRYHHRRHPTASQNDGNVWAEIIWTGLPTLIVLGLFWTGWTSFKAMRTIPDGAMVVQVEARMWSWKFTYDNGRTATELVIPIDTPVQLDLSSRDVIHSFYVPAMRVKWDMVPGLETDAWIQSDTLGEFDIFCAEYCGLRHADMMAVLRVVERDEYDKWVAGELDPKAEDPKGFLLMESYGCYDCHAQDGSEDFAPTLNDIANKERRIILPDGAARTVKADFHYLRTSLTDPGAELVEGWYDEMPSYAGDMTDEEIDAVVNYMLGLDENGEPLSGAMHPGLRVAEVEGCLKCHSTDGAEGRGPTFRGLYGSSIIVHQGGRRKQVTVDDAYLRQSIKNSSLWIADGYQDSMPPYGDLDDETVDQLISLIESLGDMP